MFKSILRMGRKCDLSDVDCGMVVGATWAGLIIFETAKLLVFLLHAIVTTVKNISEQQFCKEKLLVDERDQTGFI